MVWKRLNSSLKEENKSTMPCLWLVEGGGVIVKTQSIFSALCCPEIALSLHLTFYKITFLKILKQCLDPGGTDRNEMGERAGHGLPVCPVHCP